MKDPTDPGTLEMHPAKRGRPVADPDRGPMTPAERARRYRELRKARAGRIAHNTRYLDPEHPDYLDTVVQVTDAVLLDAIRAEAAFLDKLVTGPQRGRGAAPARKRVGALVAELARRYPVK